MLPVPWRHFVVLLNPPDDAVQLENYLGTRFIQLLESPSRPSFNVLLTRRSMHVIPRRTEGFSLIDAGWGVYTDGAANAVPYSGTLSVNALGMYIPY